MLKILVARVLLWWIDRYHLDRDTRRDALALLPAPKPLEPRTRSRLWPSVRMLHLVDHPVCELCGNTNRDELEVHHIEPFHLAPERELDPTNLITLCERSVRLPGLNCHFWAGHLGAWRSINPRVRAVVEKLRSLFAANEERRTKN